MSRIKLYLLGFITLCTTIAAWGQDQITIPRDCNPATPLSGYTYAGDFYITPTPACLDANGDAYVSISNPKPPSGNFDPGILYQFNYREVNGGLVFPTATAGVGVYTYKQEGTYWIAVNGKQGSTSFITCKSIEVINPKITEVSFDFCTPLNVKLEIKNTPDNVKQGGVRIEWGDGSSNEYIISSYPYTIDHNYNPSNPPTSDIKVEGMYIRNGSSFSSCNSTPATLPITPIPPKISELEGLNGGTENKITMKDGNPGTIYNIEMSTNNGTWTATGQTIQAPTASNTSSVTITGLNATNEYCFRLSKAGACATSIRSNEVCTIKPTYNVLSPKEVKVDWTTAQGSITRYQVFYVDLPNRLYPNSGYPQPSNGTTYTYDQMDCSTDYEFRIEGTITGSSPADRVTIKSPTFIVKPFQGGRIPFENVVLVSNSNNTIFITPLYPFPKTNIYRAEGNSTNFQKVATITDTDFYWTDPNVEISKQQYCYKIDYQDECGNTSEESSVSCTIFLTSAQPNTLNWTPYSIIGSPNLLQDVQPTEYTLEVLDENGIVDRTSLKTLETEADVKSELDLLLNNPSNNGKVIFRVTAIQQARVLFSGQLTDFNGVSFSNTYTFLTPAQVYFPSAFTPNGDTHNDVFLATGKFIAEFNMIIYDRWGAPIFESKDIKIGWDGKENGSPAPTGYYSFKIFGIDNAGQEFSKTGSVLLMR